jgi:hypothetical protein
LRTIGADTDGRTDRAKLAPKATLKVYAGGPHDMAQVRPEEFNADLLALIQG